MSQPEENREKSAKTDAVLRPPTAGGRERPRPSRGGRKRSGTEPARPEAAPTEEA